MVGEVDVQLGESVRNTNVFILHSTCPPVNENLVELFFLTRCLRRASVKTVTAVIPYFGYARQVSNIQQEMPARTHAVFCVPLT
jgi:ribose-phosphate pyrophosphokinase